MKNNLIDRLEEKLDDLLKFGIQRAKHRTFHKSKDPHCLRYRRPAKKAARIAQKLNTISFQEVKPILEKLLTRYQQAVDHLIALEQKTSRGVTSWDQYTILARKFVYYSSTYKKYEGLDCALFALVNVLIYGPCWDRNDDKAIEYGEKNKNRENKTAFWFRDAANAIYDQYQEFSKNLTKDWTLPTGL